MTTPVFQIVPSTQQYDWGKRGLSSKVAQFAAASKVGGFELDESKPYAEVRVVSENFGSACCIVLLTLMRIYSAVVDGNS